MRIPSMVNLTSIPNMIVQSTGNLLSLLNSTLASWQEAGLSTMYQTSGGSTPSEDTDPVGYLQNIQSDSLHATASSGARPTYESDSPQYLIFDQVDDDLEIDFTGHALAGSIVTYVEACVEGVWSGTIEIPNGVWSPRPASNKTYGPSPNLSGFMIFNRILTTAEIIMVRQYWIDKGCASGFSGTIISRAWSDNDNLRTVDYQWLDLENLGNSTLMFVSSPDINVVGYESHSPGNDLYYAFSGIQNTSFDISGWGDLSAITRFAATWQNCASLTSFTCGSTLSTVTTNNFAGSWKGCGLDQASVDHILESVESAGTSNGTLDINLGTNAVPSATGLSYKTLLEGRGWTVNVNS